MNLVTRTLSCMVSSTGVCIINILCVLLLLPISLLLRPFNELRWNDRVTGSDFLPHFFLLNLCILHSSFVAFVLEGTTWLAVVMNTSRSVCMFPPVWLCFYRLFASSFIPVLGLFHLNVSFSLSANIDNLPAVERRTSVYLLGDILKVVLSVFCHIRSDNTITEAGQMFTYCKQEYMYEWSAASYFRKTEVYNRLNLQQQ